MNWKWFGKIHGYIYQKSGGWIGSPLGGMDCVLMHIPGRSSGEIYYVPASCYPYKNSYMLVASNSGLPDDPQWWNNLKENPVITAQVGRNVFTAKAVEIKGKERESCWQQIVEINPRQQKYQDGVERILPVIYLDTDAV